MNFCFKINSLSSKQVCDELVILNVIEFKGKCLFTEDAKVRSKVTNPNTKTYTSPDWFKLLRFMNNSSVLGNNIDTSEERDLHVDLKRTVRNLVKILNTFYYLIVKK